MTKLLRHIAGYFVGGIIFLILLPYGFYELAKLDLPLFQRILFHSTIIKNTLSLLFFLTGMLFMIWSNIFLLRIGKGGPADGLGIAISPRTKKLVTSGPYRYSRNPMVFGALSLYASLVLFLNSLTGLLAVIFFLLLIVPYLKIFEEKRLLHDFGNQYIQYKKNVSMIFPLKVLKKQ